MSPNGWENINISLACDKYKFIRIIQQLRPKIPINNQTHKLCHSFSESVFVSYTKRNVWYMRNTTKDTGRIIIIMPHENH